MDTLLRATRELFPGATMSHEFEVIWMRAHEWHESAPAPRRFTDEFKEKVRCHEHLEEASPNTSGSDSMRQEQTGPSKEETPPQ